MTQQLPELVHVKSRETGRPVVYAGGKQYADLAALLKAHPSLATPSAAAEFAEAANHFAQGQSFSVIRDPAAYEAGYRARIDAEDPSKPWVQGEYRLRNYGQPDFSAIEAPKITDGKVVFFVTDGLVGVPYRIESALDGTPLVDASYVPMPLTPVDAPRTIEPDKPVEAAREPERDKRSEE